MSQKKIEAVVEIQPFEESSPWTVSPASDWSYMRLFAGVTDEEIGSLILTACSYNGVEVKSSPFETLEAFVAEVFDLPGGLRFSEAGQVKVVPGCCAGLEDWREWLEAPQGKSVWAGHDPNPRVEFTDGTMRIWQDEKAEGVEFIDFGVEEFHDLLKEVESDLKGFLFKLGMWADFMVPELKPKMVEHFARNMDI